MRHRLDDWIGPFCLGGRCHEHVSSVKTNRGRLRLAVLKTLYFNDIPDGCVNFTHLWLCETFVSYVESAPLCLMQVSLGEKQALDYVLRYFEERTANLKKLVYYQDRRLKRLGLIDDCEWVSAQHGEREKGSVCEMTVDGLFQT